MSAADPLPRAERRLQLLRERCRGERAAMEARFRRQWQLLGVAWVVGVLAIVASVVYFLGVRNA